MLNGDKRTIGLTRLDSGMSEAKENQERRVELKRAYGVAYARLSDILFSEDPIGINFEDNTDEYEVEADTILPRLRGVHSVEDVRAIVHQEFVKWFEAFIAGPPEKYH